MQNPYRYIDFWAEIKPSQIAVRDEKNSLTYKELSNTVLNLSNKLQQDGYESGDIACLVMPSFLGYIFNLTLNSMGISTLSKFDSGKFPSFFDPDHILTVNDLPGFEKYNVLKIDGAFMNEVSEQSEGQILSGFKSKSNVCLYVTTSGTTGQPKYMAITADQLAEIAKRPGTNDSFGPDGVFSALPFGSAWATFHSRKCLMLGKTYYTFGKFDEGVVNLINNNPIKTLIGSSSQISSILGYAQNFGSNLPNIESFIIGGDALTENLTNRIKDFSKARIYHTYGSTEVGHIAISELSNTYKNSLKIRPEVTVEILDDAGNKLLNNQIGTVRTSGPNMLTSYLGISQQDSSYFKDGFHYPGDSGYLTEDGELVLISRQDDVLHIGGAKIDSLSVFQYLNPVLKDLEWHAVDWQNPSLGISELAIVIKGPIQQDIQNLYPSISKVYSGDVNIFVINVNFPLNSGGKVDLTALRAVISGLDPDLRISASTQN
jgi:acyl-coenzyme A synthetase/AMP-(fatty) acid ligase